MTLPGMYHQETVQINAAPDVVYDLVSDLPRMGEWSPENDGGDWVGNGTGEVGDRFLGLNRIGEREWSVTCEVTIAERGREFQFVTSPDDGPYVRWSFKTEVAPEGTLLTQTWDVETLPPTLVGASDDRIAARAAMVREAMAVTLAAVKSTVEAP